MATQKCLDNIKAEKTDYNHLCTGKLPSDMGGMKKGTDYCVFASTKLNEHCNSMKYNVDDPAPTFDFCNQEWCYCCCTCFALGTLIETSPENFIAIEKINSGDQVLTSGVDLVWKSNKVDYRDGSLSLTTLPGLYCVRYIIEGEIEPHDIIVSPDHLFLMNTSRTLKKVQHLIPGNKLTTKDGKSAIVQFVAIGSYITALQTIQMEGEVNLNTLEGHLLNSNGVITADYAVQLYYETNKLDDKLIFAFSNPNSVHEVGTEEYKNEFGCDQLNDFLNDESTWPAGFVPKRHQIINIPKQVRSFLTKKQAQDVKNNGEFNPYNIRTGMRNIEKIFQFAKIIYPNITYVLDWNNKIPNAYAWEQDGQKFIVISGELVRLKTITDEGWALVIAFLQASLSGNYNTVGEMDYYAIENMRNIFTDDIFVNYFTKAVAQIKELFKLVSEKHAAGDKDDIANNPPLDCRIQAYIYSASFLPIPECVLPKPKYLEFRKAYASIDNKQVNVVFSGVLDESSATDINNYEFIPAVKVLKAECSKETGIVILDVEGLNSSSKYILTVNNVKADYGAQIAEDANCVIIKTP